MQAILTKSIAITLTLNEDEALWLRALVQNPIGVSPSDENPDIHDKRLGLFQALTNALKDSHNQSN
jgi:hypothetical protein